MGIYGYVYDCRSAEEKKLHDENADAFDPRLFCCGTWATLTNNHSLYFSHICSKHRPVKGNVFLYSLDRFCTDARIFSAGTGGERHGQQQYHRVEVVDAGELVTRRGKVVVVRMRTDLDCSTVLGAGHLMLFSCFDGEPAAVVRDGSQYIITLPFDDYAVHRPEMEDRTIGYDYNWNRARKIRSAAPGTPGTPGTTT